MGNYFSTPSTPNQYNLKEHGFTFVPIPLNIQPVVKQLLSEIEYKMSENCESATLNSWNKFKTLKNEILQFKKDLDEWNLKHEKYSFLLKDCHVIKEKYKFDIEKSKRFQEFWYNKVDGYINLFEKEFCQLIEQKLAELDKQINENKFDETKEDTEISASEVFHLRLFSSLGTVSEKHPFNQRNMQILAKSLFKYIAIENRKLDENSLEKKEEEQKEEEEEEQKEEEEEEQKEEEEEENKSEDSDKSEKDGLKKELYEYVKKQNINLTDFISMFHIKHYPKEWMNIGIPIKNDILPNIKNSIIGIITSCPIKIKVGEKEYMVTIPENHMLITLGEKKCKILNDKQKEEKEDKYKSIVCGVHDKTQNNSFIVFSQKMKKIKN